VRALEHFNKYLYRQEFHLHTDHSALTWLMSFKNLEGQMARWFSAYKSTTSLLSIVKAENTTMPVAFCNNYAKRGVPTATKSRQVQAIAAVAAAGWEPTALRTEQLNDQDIVPILEEVETGQCPEWKDIAATHSPMYKSYWTQWKSFAVRNGILERHWESTNRRSKVAQIILPRMRVNDVVTKLHDGRSGGHLGQQDPEYGPAKVLVAPGKKQC
jgi:hypothetical protein